MGKRASGQYTVRKDPRIQSHVQNSGSLNPNLSPQVISEEFEAFATASAISLGGLSLAPKPFVELANLGRCGQQL